MTGIPPDSQGKRSGNGYCQDLGNNREPGCGLCPGPGTELPETHPLTTNSLFGTVRTFSPTSPRPGTIPGKLATQEK